MDSTDRIGNEGSEEGAVLAQAEVSLTDAEGSGEAGHGSKRTLGDAAAHLPDPRGCASLDEHQDDGAASTKLNVEEEMKSLTRVIAAYMNYPFAAEWTVQRWERAYARLPPRQQALLSHLPAKYTSIRTCIAHNANFLTEILQAFEPPFLPSASPDFHSHAGDHALAHGNYHDHAHAHSDDHAHGNCHNHAHDHASAHAHAHSHENHQQQQPHTPAAMQTPDVPVTDPVTRRDGGEAAFIRTAADVATRNIPVMNAAMGLDGGEGIHGLEEDGGGRRKITAGGRSISQDTEEQQHFKEVQQPLKESEPVAALQSVPENFQGTSNQREGSGSAMQGASGAEKSAPQQRSLPQGVGSFAHVPRVYPPPWFPSRPRDLPDVPPADVDKVRCVLRNVVRDWAAEGAEEREQCYAPILRELRRKFPGLRRAEGGADGGQQIGLGQNGEGHIQTKEGQQQQQPQQQQPLSHPHPHPHPHLQPPTCLVPGAGLGRLALEISRLGFETQGNDFSYYILICSGFLLNYPEFPGQFCIFPWILSSSNNLEDEDQVRPVRVPDLVPSLAGITEGFSMCAGDFVEVYSHPEQRGAWDSVATCFFIDTARNIVDYIEILYKLLRPGGVWVNLGPLLYHFADTQAPDGSEEMSIELSATDVKRLALQCGFRLEREEMVKANYTSNPRSMMRTEYTCVLWTMVKDL